MNYLTTIGAVVVTLALTFYSIGIITEQRTRLISARVIGFVSFGLLFDITATVLMIVGSSRPMFTWHGIIGYCALTLMMIDTTFLWQHRLMHSTETLVARRIHLYSRFAYTWWVAAYITGALLVAI